MMTFQKFFQTLTQFWEKQGCIIHQGYDLEVGAGTFNPATFLRCLGPEPYRAAYIEPCRRPTDGRYGTNPNRLQHYFQYQVILKPSPLNIQDLYLKSLEAVGFNLKEHDIRFVHDDWESPTLGAWGLGWEVWMDGMEITQFTYFQAVGGVELKPITGEITYGIERLAMYLQKVDSVYDLQWNEHLTYGDIYKQNEVEWSHYNFEKASTEMWFHQFEDYEKEAKRILSENLPIPAYDFVMKASHAFNLLDARGVISVTERTGYIARIRDLAKLIAEGYIKSREEQGFPLLNRFKSEDIQQESHETALSDSLTNVHSDDVEDFLLEIGSEELPATFVSIGQEQLQNAVIQLLQKNEIPFEQVLSYATPRRLTLFVKKLAKGKPAQIVERKGPAIEQAYDEKGHIKNAGEGFFRSIGMDAPSLKMIQDHAVTGLEIRSVKGVDYLFAKIHKEGRATALILTENLPQMILNLDFPKKMRWGDLTISYARPLRWIVALFGQDVLPFTVGNLSSGRLTQGHRQFISQSVPLDCAQDYLKVLRQHNVMADPYERYSYIESELKKLEEEHNFVILEQQKVILQVINLVEWPHLTLATFDEQFLNAPKEVLISEMVEHQKYFPIANHNGNLINAFIITANIIPTEQIRKGNQKVISARLSDGIFLYKEDLKSNFEKFNEKLKSMTFQKDLGTVYDKVERILAHSKILQKMLGISSSQLIQRAALLSKADLASQMVYEFPELQGVIGRYYAIHHGEDLEVAQAIDEHWMPRGENAPLPQSATGIILSLADKIDNLLGCFSVGLKPTSSSDPYALRRQVLGMIKILIQGQYTLPLKECLLACAKNFGEKCKNSEEVVNEIIAFITNRLKTVLLDYNFKKDEIEACLSKGCYDIYDTFRRIQALHEFRKHSPEQFSSFYEVFKRSKGQIGTQKSFSVDAALLKEPSEIALNHLLEEQTPFFNDAIIKHHYSDVYNRIATIQPAIATLFNEVKIMDENQQIRENRVGLLQKVFSLFELMLDLNKIQ